MLSIQILSLAIMCLCAYLIGSIPFSVWLGKLLSGEDLRKIGVGNPGGFHACTVYGPAIGLPIMFLDFIKGAIVIVSADQIFSLEFFISTNGLNIWHTLSCILSPFFCILGHNYSIFLGLKGGQGVGIFIGTLLYLNPLVIIIFFSISSIFIGGLKKDVSRSQLISILFCIIVALFLPIGPPWSKILSDWNVGQNNLIHLTPGFILLSISLALLIRYIQQLFINNKKWTFSLREGQKDVK